MARHGANRGATVPTPRDRRAARRPRLDRTLEWRARCGTSQPNRATASGRGRYVCAVIAEAPRDHGRVRTDAGAHRRTRGTRVITLSDVRDRRQASTSRRIPADRWALTTAVDNNGDPNAAERASRDGRAPRCSDEPSSSIEARRGPRPAAVGLRPVCVIGVDQTPQGASRSAMSARMMPGMFTCAPARGVGEYPCEIRQQKNRSSSALAIARGREAV